MSVAQRVVWLGDMDGRGVHAPAFTCYINPAVIGGLAIAGAVQAKGPGMLNALSAWVGKWQRWIKVNAMTFTRGQHRPVWDLHHNVLCEPAQVREGLWPLTLLH